MTIHLAGKALLYIYETQPRMAASLNEEWRVLGADVVVDTALPPRSGYYQTTDGRRLEFALDHAGIHPLREADGPLPVVRAAG